MNHDDIQRALPDYHDRELSAEQTELVKRHLDICADCRNELSNLQHLATLIGPRTSQDDTEQFVQRVMARLPMAANEPVPPTSFWDHISVVWKVPALAFCAVLLVAVGAQLNESSPSTRSLLCDGKSNATINHVCNDDAVQSDEVMNLLWGDL